MRAGDLDRTISRIESRRDIISAGGQSKPTWSTFASRLPAKYDPQQGREYFAAQAMVVFEPALFGIYYREGIVPEMRLWFEGKVWNIAAVEPLGRKVWMLLYCHTGLNEGG